MKNPLRPGDYSLFMSATRSRPAALKQTVSGPFEQGCAYYLYFRLLNVTPPTIQAEIYATVAYLDKNRRIINSTPLLVRPPRRLKSWYPYFSIVPTPPRGTAMLSIVFLLASGTLFVDYISIASHKV